MIFGGPAAHSTTSLPRPLGTYDQGFTPAENVSPRPLLDRTAYDLAAYSSMPRTPSLGAGWSNLPSETNGANSTSSPSAGNAATPPRPSFSLDRFRFLLQPTSNSSSTFPSVMGVDNPEVTGAYATAPLRPSHGVSRYRFSSDPTPLASTPTATSIDADFEAMSIGTDGFGASYGRPTSQPGTGPLSYATGGSSAMTGTAQLEALRKCFPKSNEATSVSAPAEGQASGIGITEDEFAPYMAELDKSGRESDEVWEADLAAFAAEVTRDGDDEDVAL